MASREISDVLPRKGAPFDPKVLRSAIGLGTSKEYRKKQVIFAQGAGADEVFYLQKGRVKLSVLSKQGKEAVIAIFAGGAFFGEGCLPCRPRRVATASAV